MGPGDVFDASSARREERGATSARPPSHIDDGLIATVVSKGLVVFRERKGLQMGRKQQWSVGGRARDGFFGERECGDEGGGSDGRIADANGIALRIVFSQTREC